MARALLVLLSLLLAAPAGASWDSHGHREPDTRLDAEGAWMWQDAPPPGSARLYFHAYPTLAPTSANPNVALLGPRVAVVPLVHWEAVLGIWSDCNGDGAIGLGEAALARYPATLLLTPSRCPAGGAHNDGATVEELLALAPHAAAPFFDPEARVWGDAGRPGAAGLEACTFAPLPRGTTSNTGRALRVVDCAAEHRAIGAINTVDNDGSLGLAIEDPHHPERSGSLLVRDLPASLFGNPMNGQQGLLQEDGDPAFRARDCGAGGVSLAEDPLAASWWSAIGQEADAWLGDCDPETGTPLSGVHPGVEQPFEPTSHTGRDRNDLVFAFHAPAPPRVGAEPWQAALMPSASPPLAWRATQAYVATPPTLSRGSLAPQGPSYWTFYASVGDGLRHALPGDPATYGSEACGLAKQGVRNGWQCDATRWWQDPAGDAMPTAPGGAPLGARVGEAYQLRDVDCVDGTLSRDVDVSTSPGALVAGYCDTSASP